MNPFFITFETVLRGDIHLFLLLSRLNEFGLSDDFQGSDFLKW